jgi:hypothetical protein
MPLNHDYLRFPHFAGINGGGGNRTRVPCPSDSPLFQRKRMETLSAYWSEQDFLKEVDYGAWVILIHLELG